jgi:hypothetical protein
LAISEKEIVKFYNEIALINQLHDEDLEKLGIYFCDDEIQGLENIKFPVEVDIDDCQLGQYDWDHIREGRFDLSGQRPEEYAKPTSI